MKENEKYKVNEIFYSIDGEGLRAGSLAVFVRLAGCNLHCRYCDTAYALDLASGVDMSADEIAERVRTYKCSHVTLTGGEPLCQNCLPLIKKLADHGIHTNIETNGSRQISKYIKKYTTITMDWKTPASGEDKEMLYANIPYLRENDVLKFVCDRNDLSSVFDTITECGPKCWVYLSPIFGKIEPSELVEFMKKCNASGINTEKIKTQIQLHKIIWDPNKRGV